MTFSPHRDGLACLSTTVSELFRLLLNHARLQTSNAMFRTLEREYSYLQLWCDGYGVPFGHLDAILAESKRLRHSTLRLLVSICHTLADSKFEDMPNTPSKRCLK